MMNRGVIVVGYQGIGKSTLSNQNLHFIDLESSNFWNASKRPIDWYIYYSNIAVDLASQGYIVFTSSHKEVRQKLTSMKFPVGVHLVGVVPSEFLKDEWIKKLKDRFDTSGLDKDYKAWMNADDRFIENIREIKKDLPLVCEITRMDYDLKLILQSVFNQEGWLIYT